MRSSAVLVIAALSTLPNATRLSAQSPRRIMSINHVLLITGSVQGEVEQRVSPRVSVALSGSAVRLADRYTNADLKLRYYPNPRGRVLDGVGFAIGAGYGHVTDRNVGVICASSPPGGGGGGCYDFSESYAGPTVTAEVTHQWIAKAPHHMVLTVGAGVKRYFVEERLPATLQGFPQLTGTARVSVGYALY
ncbi:hypothetical protein [Gemmatimonas phototrophica]|uniref:Outer membrane protein beta-barrel domain-containing protein n=1 Tax=Gemmatimonas phototrophica TaxID=1379270 RepID=A0A143BH93_9BACT|nr:hypothetical protein [Gemmatimonas phototrophica]AMW03830.1 hypothetical protein GEMMAAP_01165 [Gemmatimonas phototrophica]